MIVAPSAIAAILLKEPESSGFRELLGRRGGQLSAPGYLELSIVLTARGVTDPVATLDAILLGLGVEVVPFTPSQARPAQEAHLRFGRGSGHPARLNFGDCISHALARTPGNPFCSRETISSTPTSIPRPDRPGSSLPNFPGDAGGADTEWCPPLLCDQCFTRPVW